MPTPPTPNAITVVYDPSGTLVGNTIRDELVYPLTQCAIFPKQGAFYQAGFTATAIRISDGETVTLVPNVDFEWSPPYSKQIDVLGAIVYSYILLKDVSLWTSATINYQAVGCENDAILLQQIIDLGNFDRLDFNTWKLVEGDYVVSADTVRPDIFNNGRTIFVLSRLLGGLARTTLSPAAIFNDIMAKVNSIDGNLGFVQSKVDALQASYTPPDLSGYVLKTSIPNQAVAEAGTDLTPRAWTALSVAQSATAVFNALKTALITDFTNRDTVVKAYADTIVNTLRTYVDGKVTILQNNINAVYTYVNTQDAAIYAYIASQINAIYSYIASQLNAVYAYIVAESGFTGSYVGGYIIFPRWLGRPIIQWMAVPMVPWELMTPVAWPIAFPNATLFVLGNSGASIQTGNSSILDMVGAETSFTPSWGYISNATAQYIAINVIIIGY